MYKWKCFLNFSLFTLTSLSFIDAQCLPDDTTETRVTKAKAIFSTTSDELSKRAFPISTAAIVDRIVFHPIESVITIQQSHVHKNYSKLNFCEGASVLYKNGGLSAFYKGFAWPMLNAIPNRFLVFGTYYAARRHLESYSLNEKHIYSGVLASIVKAISSCPSEAERTRQVCGIHVTNRFSPQSLFKGLLPLSIKHISALAPSLAGTDILIHRYQSIKESALGPFVIASAISFVFQTISTPADMLKTRVMEDYTGKTFRTHLTQLKRDKNLIFRTFWSRAFRSSGGAGLTIGIIHLSQSLMGHDE